MSNNQTGNIIGLKQIKKNEILTHYNSLYIILNLGIEEESSLVGSYSI